MKYLTTILTIFGLYLIVLGYNSWRAQPKETSNENEFSKIKLDMYITAGNRSSARQEYYIVTK